ncbi:MAG: sugar transferase [bacterium]|nr:sugar transferase [bacterium]
MKLVNRIASQQADRDTQILRDSYGTEKIPASCGENGKERLSREQANTGWRYRLRSFLIFVAGPVSSLLLAVSLMAIAIQSQQLELSAGIELLSILVFTRLGFVLLRPDRPVLKTPIMHRKMSQVAAEESIQFLILVTACWLLEAGIPRLAAVAFLTVNLTAQMMLLQVTKSLLSRVRFTGENQPSHRSRNRAIIVGTGERAKEVADLILDCPEMDTTLTGFLDYGPRRLWSYRDRPIVGHPDDLERFASEEHLDTVILAVDLEEMQQTHALFATAEKMGVPVCFMPDIYRGTISRARTAHLNGFPAIIYRAVPEGKLSQLIKSFIDRLGALVGIILAAPLMFAAAMAIKVDSRGPILFKQRRSGLNGRVFGFLKFRTMCIDAEQQKSQLADLNEMSGPVFKIRQDPRITRVGRFLRKYSIDELPQLFNVLRGEMSLVGPRPPLPREVAQYEPWQRRKLSVKPGVTCLWQVNGRNQIDFEDWMRLDLEYIDNWSLLLDARILARTLPAVLKGDGAS